MCVVPINTSTLGGGSRKEMVVGVIERGEFLKLQPCGGMRMVTGQAAVNFCCQSHVLVSQPTERSRLCPSAGERSREKGRHAV